jgi:transposase
MPMLAETIDGVIGVDTHRDTLTAAAVTSIGGLLDHATAATDRAGYQDLLAFAAAQLPGRRCWAIEGAGSFGAGLATFLLGQGEQVMEVPRRRRSTRRTAAKSDALDAVHIARDALITEHPAIVRRRGDREALRVLLTTRRNAVTAWTQTVSQLKALIVAAPEELRAELRGRGTKAQITYCAALRVRPTRSLEHQMTARALRATARRCQLLRAEITAHQDAIQALVLAIAPWLLELPGVGPITGAQVLISWSHAGRWRSEAAFAALAGTSPIPASSGQTTRYRLNRRGDRQLNHALHTIAIVRMRDDPLTRAYVQRRTAEGKNPREIRRCLKRIIARQLYKLLDRYDRPDVHIAHAA